MILSSIFLDFLFLPTPLQFSPPHISTQYWPDTIYCSVNCISVFFYFFFWSSNTNCSKFQIGVWYFDNFVFVSIKDVFLLSKPEFPSFLSNRIFKTKPGKKKREKKDSYQIGKTKPPLLSSCCSVCNKNTNLSMFVEIAISIQNPATLQAGFFSLDIVQLLSYCKTILWPFFFFSFQRR